MSTDTLVLILYGCGMFAMWLGFCLVMGPLRALAERE